MIIIFLIRTLCIKTGIIIPGKNPSCRTPRRPDSNNDRASTKRAMSVYSIQVHSSWSAWHAASSCYARSACNPPPTWATRCAAYSGRSKWSSASTKNGWCGFPQKKRYWISSNDNSPPARQTSTPSPNATKIKSIYNSRKLPPYCKINTGRSWKASMDLPENTPMRWAPTWSTFETKWRKFRILLNITIRIRLTLFQCRNLQHIPIKFAIRSICS